MDTASRFLAVAQLNAQYASVIDNDRLEQWPDFFTPQCLYRITTAGNFARGYEASIVFANSRGMLVDRVSALRTANIYERQSYRHIMAAPVILGAQGEDMRSETSFAVVRIMRDGATILFASGRYLDAIVQDGSALMFRERIVVCDSPRIDTLLAIPL
ncbi:MAG: terephthalate 1,2-dioxygenase [Alphaproteobacteria bacterium]|nr:terephthalate 1,2-dioxygenase [Alphaproteobacteria bacterium]